MSFRFTLSGSLRGTFSAHFTALAVCVAALSPNASHAEVYRWVDENGVVNYTQHKPEDRRAESVTPRPSKPAKQDPADEASTTADTSGERKLTEEQQRMLDELKAKESERQAALADIRESMEF